MNNDNYEVLYKELNEIVNKLQNDDLDIDTSIELFKRGVEIKNKCLDILNKAQEEVVGILDKDNNIGEFSED